MTIKRVNVEPCPDSILPSLRFNVELGYTRCSEAIVSIDGWLLSDDGKILSRVHEVAPEAPRTWDVGAKGSVHDAEFKEETCILSVIAFLTEGALDYIEERRGADRLRSARFILKLNAKLVSSHAVIFPLFSGEPKELIGRPVQVYTSRGSEKATMLFTAYDEKYDSQYTNRWIISGTYGPVFLRIVEHELKPYTVEIAAPKWIHDFLPALRLGEYFTVEIPKPKGIIKEAWDCVTKAEECFRLWNTKGVYANCREAGYRLDATLKQSLGKDSFAYKERWGRMYARFEHLASLDLHLEQIRARGRYSLDEVRVGRADAEQVLVTTKVLVKYAEELLKEYGKIAKAH